jgi:CxxC motif-containing protein (DUF1111 family)
MRQTLAIVRIMTDLTAAHSFGILLPSDSRGGIMPGHVMSAHPFAGAAMNARYWLWYLLTAVVVLTPAGLRFLSWRGTTHATLEASAVGEGKTLFHHEWKPNDPLARGGDGLGPVFNAKSCVACHNQGGPGGGGGLDENVTAFSVSSTSGARAREGIVHAHATKYRESLQQVHPDLPDISIPTLDQLVASVGGPVAARIRMPMGVTISMRNTPALFGAKLIDEIPAYEIIAMEKVQRMRWGFPAADTKELPVGRAVRLADGRVGRFGWKGQTASLTDFVQAACANELGLGNPNKAQPAPLGKEDYQPPGLDLTLEQCDQITAFCAALPRPTESLPIDTIAREDAVAGKQLFNSIGCAHCHVPDLGGVKGLYSDLLLHFMGTPLEASGVYYGPPPEQPIFIAGGAATSGEWRTPPLWGCADSAPYLHDGRAANLEAAISLHGGQGAKSAARFAKLSPAEQKQVIAFLKTLRAPPQ